ncbi:hypothetical protein ACH5RR_011249 [Cinchona calisaya]|uniref:Uncharacterized protein n=1 Tax=Cinchona calisaya TaxID=153742 RepID=A0ABD3AA60_9GENT
MEKMIETPLQSTINQIETNIVDTRTPHNLHPPINICTISQNSASKICKPTTPNRLKVPKAFKYPERYTSPTDLMMSPVSRGLLARSRKASPLLPPSKNQTNLQSSKPQEVGLFGI